MPKGQNTLFAWRAKVDRQLADHEARIKVTERELHDSSLDMMQLTDLAVRIEERSSRLRKVILGHGTRITKLEKRRGR